MTVSPDSLPRGVTELPKRRRLVNAKTLSDLYGWPLTSVYDNTRAGKIPGAIRIGRRIMYDLDKLEPWLDAGGEYARAKE